jgi:hypothetical protein
MPDLTSEMIEQVKRAGYRHIQFDADEKVEVSKDSKEMKWEPFDCKAGEVKGSFSVMTIPRFLPVDLDSL